VVERGLRSTALAVARAVPNAARRRRWGRARPVIVMVFDDLHREEARATDHNQSVQDLIDVGPPCDDCGRAEAIEDGLCPDCLDS
jgi:hypothetical protein